MRVEAQITDATEVRQVEWLQSVLGVSRKPKLIRDALALLGWAVREVLAGRQIASIGGNDSDRIYTFSTPLLERASWMHSERVVLSPEGAQQITEMLDNPPEPSDRLRQLMSRTG
jgi:hypothetical protein